MAIRFINIILILWIWGIGDTAEIVQASVGMRRCSARVSRNAGPIHDASGVGGTVPKSTPIIVEQSTEFIELVSPCFKSAVNNGNKHDLQE